MTWNDFIKLSKQLTLLSGIHGCYVVIFLALAGCNHTTEPEQPSLSLVWQDEFNGVAGTQIDSTRWSHEIGSGWGNNQLEYDTNRPENISQDGVGNLAITARKEYYKGQSYTSARITTKGLAEFTYGRVEARIKLPVGQGLWPAFWMLGANDDSVTWPKCGEIDIMEYRGQIPNGINGSAHGPNYSGRNAITKPYYLINDRFDNRFHTFAVAWGKDYLKYFVDDTLYQVITPANITGTWVFDHPFYIILNLAVGGDYVGSPNATTPFPQTMLIDWVRVYKEVE
ncbi:MAG: glycoside hydrolase family 16 protein [Ignavibacteriae bacterium]|nr:glycoside hydrolase family 16 protein [Ignavibacteriota bacterium]